MAKKKGTKTKAKPRARKRTTTTTTTRTNPPKKKGARRRHYGARRRNPIGGIGTFVVAALSAAAAAGADYVAGGTEAMASPTRRAIAGGVATAVLGGIGIAAGSDMVKASAVGVGAVATASAVRAIAIGMQAPTKAPSGGGSAGNAIEQAQAAVLEQANEVRNRLAGRTRGMGASQGPGHMSGLLSVREARTRGLVPSVDQVRVQRLRGLVTVPRALTNNHSVPPRSLPPTKRKPPPPCLTKCRRSFVPRKSWESCSPRNAQPLPARSCPR